MNEPVLHAELERAGDLKVIVSACALVIENGKFVATSKGLTLRMMDASRVSLLDTFLDASSFKEYKIESNITFGVMVDMLNRTLKHIADDEPITLDVSNTMLTISYKSTKYNLTPTIPDEKTENTPKFTSDVSIEFPGDQLSRLMDRVGIISNAVKFSVKTIDDKTTLTMSARDDGGSMQITLPDKEFEGVKISPVTDVVESGYNTEYFTPVVKLIKNGCTIKFSTGRPILLEALGGIVRYYVAPRIEQ